MKVFIDTSAFVAYFLKQEEFHNDVVKKYKFYSQQKATFITSDYIIDELLTWFNTRQPKYLLEKLIDSLDKMERDGELGFVRIDKTIFRKAREVLLKFSDHKISFTDATSYTLYKDFAIDEVFTLDKDFKKMRLSTSF